MFCKKVILLAAFLVAVNSKYISNVNLVENSESANFLQNVEDLLIEVPHDSVHPGYLVHVRPRRQTTSTTSLDTSGVLNSNLKVPLAGNDKFETSGIGSAGVDLKKSKLGSFGDGLAFENVKEHGASLTERHITRYGDQITGAGHVNLLHNENHRVDANAFITRTMPSNPNEKNFNTYGGGVDYMYKDKIGGSLGMSRTPLFDKTDYSAVGNLNLFKDRSSSLDFSAGLSKSVAPFIRNPSWEQSGRLIYTKRW